MFRTNVISLILMIQVVYSLSSIEYEKDKLKIIVGRHYHTKNVTIYTEEKRYDRYAMSLIITDTKELTFRLVYFKDVKIRITPSYNDKKDIIHITRVHKSFDRDNGLYYFTLIIRSKVDDMVLHIELDSELPFAAKIRKYNNQDNTVLLHPNYFNTTLIIIN